MIGGESQSFLNAPPRALNGLCVLQGIAARQAAKRDFRTLDAERCRNDLSEEFGCGEMQRAECRLVLHGDWVE